MERMGVKCYSVDPPRPDLIIASHHKIVEYLKVKFPDVPLISTIHGIIHTLKNATGEVWAPEHPSPYADKFVAVSEEVQEKLKNDYGYESEIIRNFFEIEPDRVNFKPKIILFNSNYELRTGEVYKTVKQVAEHYGTLISIGTDFTQTPDVKEEIKKADIVIGMGRSVLEGVAMGRLGIVHGRWGTGGVVCEENIKNLQRYNFSGRNNQGKWLSAEEMIREIDKHYTLETFSWQTLYMLANHEVSSAANKFISLYEDLRSKQSKE